MKPKKYKKPLCPKCSDRGWVFEHLRSKGRIAGYERVRCKKNCQAAQKWDGKSL